MRAFILLLIFFVFLFGCTQPVQDSSTNKTPAQNTIATTVTTPAENLAQLAFEKASVDNETNITMYDTDQFTISYPNGWDNLKVGKDNIILILAAPFENSSDQLRESINLGVDRLHADEDTYSYANSAISKFRSENKMLDQIEVQEVAFSGNKTAYLAIYPPANFNGLNIVNFQTFISKNGRVYIFTYLAEKDKFKNYLNTTNDIINSFVIK